MSGSPNTYLQVKGAAVDEGQQFEDDQDDKSFTQISVKDLRNLRQANKERNDLAAKAASAERELAFAKAKLDLDDSRTSYFMKGYDGELTAEAIRERAEADGFLTPATKPGTQDTGQTEMQAQQRIAKASAGAGETASPDLAQQILQASSPDEVMKLMQQANIPTAWDNT